MSEKIPKSIEELGNNNLDTLKSFGAEREDLVGDLDKSNKVGQEYLTDAFSKEGIDTNPDKKISRGGIEEISPEKRETVSNILKFDPGLVIVRPEMYHVTGKICDFLKKNGFRVDFLTEKRIQIKEYFDLYKEVIRNVPDLKVILPSRTLTYTNAKSSIIVFTEMESHFLETKVHLADLFSAKFKGREGLKAENTIRGDIVHNEALRLGFDKLEDPVVAAAVDPFAIYGEVVKGKTENLYHLKTTPELYTLMYTAQGIHCPSYAEMPRDLASILSLGQLSRLETELEKSK